LRPLDCDPPQIGEFADHRLAASEAAITARRLPAS
jgi:hypothetical protein